MAIVATTQELKAGDFLLRFKAESFQDDIHGIRSIGSAGVWKLMLHKGFFSLVCRVIFFFFTVFRFPSDICYFVQVNNTCLLVASSPK